MDDISDADLECRVCRSSAELPLRPLYSPCKCSGSIGLVHQDCLEAWLEHSKKEKCELCGFKYEFAPQYSENAPSTLPIAILLFTFCKKIAKDILPFFIRIVAACVMWLGVVPLTTCEVYRMWMRLENINLTEIYNRAPHDAITGVVLTAFIVLSFVVMVSLKLS